MPRVPVLLLLVLAALVLPATAEAAGPPVVRGSVEQVQVTGAEPGASVRLVDRRGRSVATQAAGALGGAVFRTVRPGRGYRVQTGGSTSAAVRVLSKRSAPPTTAPYDQAIPAKGYGYLTTRDGTQLAVNVQLPAGPGPYPTLVEYSGYGYANPAGGESSIAQIAVLLGYAVVDVNMRGTGCSGGAFDYFEPLQGLDGYDVIETVARQPWVARHKVGMMGISYGGISQLFVGADPAAEPRGDHAAVGHRRHRHDALPGRDPQHGLRAVLGEGPRPRRAPGVRERRPGLGLEAHPGGRRDLRGQPGPPRPGRRPAAEDRREPLLRPGGRRPPRARGRSCTGSSRRSSWPASSPTSRPAATARRSRAGSRARRASGSPSRTARTSTRSTRRRSTAGSTSSSSTSRIGHRTSRPPEARSPRAIFSAAMGVNGVTLPPDPIQGQATYAAARRAFEALPPVRVLFDNGAGGTAPGAPVAGFERAFSRFPCPGRRPARGTSAPAAR